MRITYGPEADALYSELRSATPEDSLDLEDGVTADLDGSGHVIGLEVLDVRERLGAEALTSVSLERFPLALGEPGH